VRNKSEGVLTRSLVVEGVGFRVQGYGFSSGAALRPDQDLRWVMRGRMSDSMSDRLKASGTNLTKSLGE
jgi:hypothetical protein